MAKATLTQLSVPLVDRPGALGEVTTLLAKEGVNLVAVTSETSGDMAVVRLVVESPQPALSVLKKAGLQVVETPVLCLELQNKPGALAEVATTLGKKGVNVVRVWGSSDGRPTGNLMLEVDKPAVAQPLLEKWLAKVPS